MSEEKNTGKPFSHPAPYLRSILERRDTALLASVLKEQEFEESLRFSMLKEFPDLPWQLRFLLTHPEMAENVTAQATKTTDRPLAVVASVPFAGETAAPLAEETAVKSAAAPIAGQRNLFGENPLFRLQIRAGTAWPVLRELLAETPVLTDTAIRTFGTDGLHFFLSAAPVSLSFEDYAHMLMHAIFQHMALPDRIRKQTRKGHPSALWDLAADMAAEYLRTTLFEDPQGAEIRLAVKAPLPQECDPSDPFAVYQALGDLFEDEIEPLYARFRRDDHRYWYRAPSGSAGSTYAENTVDPRVREKLARAFATRSAANEKSADADIFQNAGDPRVSPDTLRDLPKDADDPAVWQEWLKKKVTERWFSSEEEMTSGLGHSRSGQYGMAPGSREEKMILRENGKYDFTHYLHRFSTLREEMRLDQASFDYIPYYYGLMRYGNMPLLEPLEYTESRKVEELVIAIDTSGSCSLPIVQRFFAEIERILMNRENFFRKMNIHIIQCDSIIQDHTVIHSQEEWKLYLQNLTIKGRGGTNFEPVFRLVAKLRDAGDLKKLKGLLYFTDGDGAYPRYPTDYETAFVFTTRKALQFKIPEWIVPLCLDMQPAEKAPMFRT